MEVLRAHAAGEDEICTDARAGTGLSTMIGDGDNLVPPEKCPNCGSELHVDRDVCPQCGHMRALPVGAPPIEMPATTTAGSKVGAAAIGCGAAFVAAIASGIGLVFLAQMRLGMASIATMLALFAVLCFLGFRAIMGRNPNARPALYAFVIMFVVLFGGLMACGYVLALNIKLPLR